MILNSKIDKDCVFSFFCYYNYIELDKDIGRYSHITFTFELRFMGKGINPLICPIMG